MRSGFRVKGLGAWGSGGLEASGLRLEGLIVWSLRFAVSGLGLVGFGDWVAFLGSLSACSSTDAAGGSKFQVEM